MTQTLDIQCEANLPVPPAQVWETVATGSGNLRWVFEMEIEPWVGGIVSRGPSTVTVWDPPRHFACLRAIEGFSALLEYRIEAREGGSVMYTSIHREYIHPIDDLDFQRDIAEKHTFFYNHTLEQYLRHFNGRPATFVELLAPAGSQAPDALKKLCHRLGLPDDVAQGDTVQVTLPDAGQQEAVVDYLHPAFLGLRTRDGLYRFFGRNAWGWPIGMSLHLFAEGIDAKHTEQAWRTWLDETFG
ncbi:hypothetical protein [Chondromyces apiculatus]|uniref:Activator of Hsp90 ATPase 1 family protein n=1 Tax=Chondromyces apiculatus DSM 436 TaxID=1192034 RepID=A0A017SV27_9BACT|nr:hypothetical protein [Chondromyces apiculatus]EYF00460.1 Hypothetical protein CAP_0550 [Chondromyces apiculatus DSM 436]